MYIHGNKENHRKIMWLHKHRQKLNKLRESYIYTWENASQETK